jgi:hypothetical protein
LLNQKYQDQLFCQERNELGGSGVESLSLALSIFHRSFLLTPGYFG